MPEVCYRPRDFGDTALDVIRQARAICRAYAAQGFDLTLRQLYYQFVARDLFPADRTWTQVGNRWVRDPNGSPNAEPNYKWLGDIVNDARLAGLLDWSYIVDRTRELERRPSWETPAEVVEIVADQFRVDRWEGQQFRPEVWIEKDALAGVIEGVCNRHGVAYFSCRGYTSQSSIWQAAQRLIGLRQDGQEPVILHLGDHDPSGIDMTRDITDRLHMFMDAEGGAPEVRRLALNMDQVQQYRPPPNPAKITDSRARGYIAAYGVSSWELDALEPAVMAALIEGELAALRDEAQWAYTGEVEEEHRRLLANVSARWDDVAAFVADED